MEQDFFGQYLKKKIHSPPKLKIIAEYPKWTTKEKKRERAKVWHRANRKVWEICVVKFEWKSFFNGIIIYIWLTFFF